MAFPWKNNTMWQQTKNIYHFQQSLVANVMYGIPSRGMKIIGVTGTDGKTTTANLIYHILHEHGVKAAVISSVGAVIDGKKFDLGFHITTPGRFAVQSYIRQAKRAGVKYIVLEVTSHALDQYRVEGIHIDVGIITNVSHEHLDYHKTYERYVAAKAKLLKKAKVAILNKEDQSYHRLKRYELKNYHRKMITYGLKKDADINPHVFPFKTKLLGTFNIYNCLAAISALTTIGIPETAIRKGLMSFIPPVGRQEIIYSKEFLVINDFAHTPNSFEVIMHEVKKLSKNRVIHTFGSAAKRDLYKRPEMGRISAKYSDIIILTAEDPRDEPIEQINKHILAGIKGFEIIREIPEQFDYVKGKKYVFLIPDRKKAIQFAIQIAHKGDVIAFTGKGHEKSMNYGKGEEPWNETETIKEALQARKLL